LEILLVKVDILKGINFKFTRRIPKNQHLRHIRHSFALKIISQYFAPNVLEICNLFQKMKWRPHYCSRRYTFRHTETVWWLW